MTAEAVETLPESRPRSRYLGGTDVAAIVRVSPYRTPIDVQQEKLGLSPGQPTTTRMRMGLLLEDAAIDELQVREPQLRIRRTGSIFDPVYPFLGGTPDRFAFDDRGKGLIEVKWESRALYGAQGTDDVPPHVAVQWQWYAGLTRAKWGYVVRGLGTDGIAIYPLSPDPELYDELRTEAIGWWQRHIVEGQPVEPDGSESYRDWLRRVHPRDDGEILIATAEQEGTIERLGAVITARQAAEKEEELLQQKLMDGMGAASVLQWAGGRATWKVENGRASWKSIAEELGATAELIAAHTTAPARVFRIYFGKRGSK